ncbi:hypothetical protein BDV18DRAFT_158298 [Aspergillus unguis]
MSLSNPPLTTTPSTSTPSLTNLSTLTPAEKTSLVRSIASEMTATLVTLSHEIDRGTLTPENTAPIHNFIRTIQRRERKELGRAEKRVERYRAREKEWKEERKAVSRLVMGIVRGLKEIERACGVEELVRESMARETKDKEVETEGEEGKERKEDPNSMPNVH